MLTIALLVLMTACVEEVPVDTENQITLTVLNVGMTRLIEKDYELQEDMAEKQVLEILEQLTISPTNLEYIAPLANDIEYLSIQLIANVLSIDFSDEYLALDTTTEVLTRAAIVRSVAQVEEVEYVRFLVEGNEITDSLGEPITAMTADLFIDNAGEEIANYELITIRLYFANEEGDALVAVNRTQAYNTNIALEKYVIEELIKGPQASTEDTFPTLNPDAKLISATVRDGICYLNMDSSFLTQIYEVDTEVVIYSIVNTLCELPSISRVQILVDGKSDILFRETLDLNVSYSKDLDMV